MSDLQFWDHWLSIAASVLSIIVIFVAGTYVKNLITRFVIRTNSLLLYKIAINAMANKETKEIEKLYDYLTKPLYLSKGKIEVKEVYLFLNSYNLEHFFNDVLIAMRYMSDRYAFQTFGRTKQKTKKWNKIFILADKHIKKTEKYGIWDRHFEEAIAAIKQSDESEQIKDKRISNVNTLKNKYLLKKSQQKIKASHKIISSFGFKYNKLGKLGSIEILDWKLPRGLNNDLEEVSRIFKILSAVRYPSFSDESKGAENESILVLHEKDEPKNKSQSYKLQINDKELEEIRKKIYCKEGDMASYPIWSILNQALDSSNRLF